MSKIFFFGLSLLIVFVIYIFNIDKKIMQNLSSLSLNIKTKYISFLANTQNDILEYFDQVEQIKQLKEQLNKSEKYKILYMKDKNKTEDINSLFFSKATVISYVNFSDFSKVFLKLSKPTSKISALITKDGYSAGIMVKKESRYIGLLNSNEKSNYAVFVGDNLVPGITQGNYPNQNITIKYVPIWQEVKLNDEVITSGMDNIFFKGIKVGYVIGITKLSTTQELLVKPYATLDNQSQFYLYTNPKN